MDNKPILPYEYLSGSDFVDNLKRKLGCKSHQQLSDLLNIPKSTFSTWAKHERTSHEVMVRVHLRTGTPIQKLALKTEDQGLIGRIAPADQTNEPNAAYVPKNTNQANPQHETVILQSQCLSDGKLINTGEVPYPYRRVNSYGLLHANVVELETNEAIYLINKDVTDAVSGKYLIDIDGHLSINQIQRLPGKKLAIAFGESTMEVSENDITVVGRVAVTSRKE